MGYLGLMKNEELHEIGRQGSKLAKTNKRKIKKYNLGSE